MFPSACFVHIVRDGRDVLASYRELAAKGFASKYAPKLPVGAVQVAREWCSNLNAFQSDTADLDGGSILELRYEDLVSDPQSVAERLCTFLCEPYESQMLDYWRTDDLSRTEPSEFLEWKALTRQAPTNRQAGRHKRDLGQSDIREFERIAIPMLARYGYLDAATR